MLLEMRGIAKRYPGVRALDEVGITLDQGEVLGIVGENGAGKSTLMKVLAGVTRPDSGTMTLGGSPYAPRNPRDALDAGIIVIHQELSLVPDRSVAENIFLGNLPRFAGVVRRGRMEAEAARILARVGLDLPASTPVRRLGIAEQQLVEIARALTREARLIVLDEPTATLTSSEVDILFRTIGTLKTQGVGLVFISHHLEEVFHICDRVTVMRDGHTVATRPTAQWTSDSLIQAMVDRSIEQLFPKQPIKRGPVLLEVRDLALPGRFEGVSFDLHQGEVLGVGGLIGAGRTEVLRSLFGAEPRASGEVRLGGERVRIRSPRQAIAAGLTLVPEDRKAEGLILPFSVRQNVALATLDRLAWLRTFVAGGRTEALARSMVTDLRIRTPGTWQPVRGLSGGNQQKVVLGRALTTRPRVFLLDEPTRGIDVGAKVEVYRLIGELAAQGAGVLMVSSDLLELIGICDRMLVMRAGRMVGDLARNEFEQERIMGMAALG